MLVDDGVAELAEIADLDAPELHGASAAVHVVEIDEPQRHPRGLALGVLRVGRLGLQPVHRHAHEAGCVDGVEVVGGRLVAQIGVVDIQVMEAGVPALQRAIERRARRG